MNFTPRNLASDPVSNEDLEQLGIATHETEALAREITACMREATPVARWTRLTETVLTADQPFALHRWLYSCVYFERDSALAPGPAWYPSGDDIANANVTKLCETAGASDYDQLFQWAKHNRAAYWDAVIECLGIQFSTPPSCTWDEHSWLPGSRLNITDSCFQAHPDKTAIVCGDESGAVQAITYGELQTLVNRVAGGLRKAGFQPGDRIALMMPMNIQAVTAYLGTIRAGCVAVSIAESFAPREISVRLRLTDAKAIFLNESIERGGKRLPCLEKFQNTDSGILAIVIENGAAPTDRLRNPDGHVTDQTTTWERFLSSSTEFESVAGPPESETNILFSSGTTGEPKAIPWTQTTPLKCAADARFHQNVHEHSVVAWPTSLGWMMGPWLVYAALLNRGTLALFDGAPTTRQFCEFIQDARVTMLGVIPSLVRAWKNRETLSELDWSAIETFSSTGECSNSDDMLFLMSRAGYRPVIEYCGGTEIGGGYISSTVVHPNVPACFSTPALGLDFVLADDAGLRWPPYGDGGNPSHSEDQVQGEVYLVGPSIGLSERLLNADHEAIYFSEAPRFDELPPLRRHGDELVRFADGYFQACGRADDAMNLGGIKVSAVEIERCLNQMPAVRETAAIAVPATDGGPSQLVIYTVAAERAEAFENDTAVQQLKAEMQSLLSSELNPLFRIDRVVLIKELPRTASNKVMRRSLRDLGRTASNSTSA